MTIEIQTEVKQQVDEATQFADNATSLTITDQRELDAAANIVKEAKTRFKEIDEKRKSMTAPLDETKRIIMDFFRPVLDQLKTTELRIKSGMADFHRAEIERERRESEKARLEAERIEAKRQAALLKRAEKAEQKGDDSKAEALKDQAEQVYVAPAVTMAPAKSAGVSISKVWKFRVTDINKVPREYLEINEIAVNKMCQVAKSVAGEKQKVDHLIQGIEFYEDIRTSVRTA
ncbi:hypothetical protein LCGC14_0452160 [marine sediment metagenome]|uniref:Uncharacterized protein n=1 Tax=marine sediment metagenome TaxID=412755 RepID=A0A0F9SHG4_9ZZZZ